MTGSFQRLSGGLFFAQPRCSVGVVDVGPGINNEEDKQSICLNSNELQSLLSRSLGRFSDLN